MKKIFLLLFLNCSAYGNPLTVTTSVPYLKDLVENITCQKNNDNINSIIPVGMDPHTFILTPSSRTLIQNSDIFIVVGAGLEPWLHKIKLKPTQTKIVLEKFLTLRNLKNSEGDNKFQLDPHIWQSPNLTKNAVKILTQAFIKLNPENKNSYESCSARYLQDIESYVEKLKKEINLIPEKNRIIATNHDSLGYFANEFGFKIVSILGLSDEGEPSFNEFHNILQLMKKEEIHSVFLESTGGSKNIQTIAKNAHVKIGGKLYSDSFGDKGSGADTTLGMWETNMTTLVKSLQAKD